MSNLLTVSRLKTWRNCRRLHRLRYIDGWRPKTVSEALRFGSLVHTALESWWKAEPGSRGAAALEAIACLESDPFERAAAESLMVGYDTRWAADERYDVLLIEEPFFVPLVNPDTGAPSRTWTLAGKVDGIVHDRETGALLMLEHKTTTESFADDSDSYWTKLGMDAQVSHYYMGAEGLGHAVEGCLYDVLLRPRLKPLKATPEASRKYTKDGRLYANQRTEDETPEQYRQRVWEDIEANPDKYFQRRTLARTDNDIREYLGDLWAEGRMMREAELAERAPRNPEHCHRFGTCAFWSACAYGVRPEDHPESFEQVDDVHPELELQEAF